MRLFILGSALLCTALAAPIATAQRPIQTRPMEPRTMERRVGQSSADYHPRTPIVLRSQNGEALRVTNYSQRPPLRGRLADQYKGIYVNRSQALRDNRRTLTTATPRAIVQRTPEGQFVRRNGSYFRVMPGRSVSSY